MQIYKKKYLSNEKSNFVAQDKITLFLLFHHSNMYTLFYLMLKQNLHLKKWIK